VISSLEELLFANVRITLYRFPDGMWIVVKSTALE
jgi:hypothetical protein